MSGRARTATTIDELGKVGPTFGGATGFYGVLIQIGHEGQQPPCPEPSFRILRFTESKQDMLRAKKQLEAKLAGTGNILHHMRDGFTLICKDLKRQVDPDYVWPKAVQLKSEFLEYIRFIDQDFVDNRKARRTGQQEEAKTRQAEYVKKYNQKGWIKYMRKAYKLRDDIEIVPGMHTEAETQTKELNRRDAQVAKKAAKAKGKELPLENQPADKHAAEVDAADAEESKEVDAVDVDAKESKESDAEEGDVEESDAEKSDVEEGDAEEGNVGDENKDDEAPPYPDTARRSGQKFAAVSFILDDTDDMEMLLFIHAFFNSEKAAKEFVMDELNDKLYPLPVEVVDMYEWIFPVRMSWENNSLSKRVEGLEETCAEMELQESQANRREAAEHNRKLKEEARKKKAMHGEVQKQLCERLCITPEQFTAITDEETMGTNAIILLCKIEDEGERLERTQELLDQLEQKKALS